MQLVQFYVPGLGRRVGLVRGERVLDLTGAGAAPASVVELAQAAFHNGSRLAEFVERLAQSPGLEPLAFDRLLAADPEGESPWLLPPLDHPDPRRVLVSGTGLSHLGSVKSRDEMHGGKPADAAPQTDSAKMFAMGLEGGKPADGVRGAAPEWFYKGNGANLRGHRAKLTIPAYALDGGEEPEIVGCYVIDDAGQPRRLGFALGNEWSDHPTEKINYLYLAPSKLRECAVGPVLNVSDPFTDVRLRCTVRRAEAVLYDSDELRSGESAMCHSLRNVEDHHFKYAQHRQPGDVHLHFFGTSKLSYGTRTWRYEPGDEIRIEAPAFSASLVNTVAAGNPAEQHPIRVRPA
ncbi:MAG: sugar transporter [Planctomycetia bacterium]|nr:sugar transporter [Planctomycetia bacterium]